MAIGKSSTSSYTLPYAFCEQIGKEIRDISDELPFDIPESWEWCRISNLFQLINGDRGKNYPSKEKLHESGEIPFISAIKMQNGTVNESNLLYVHKEQYDKLNSGKLYQNDLVVCIRHNGLAPNAARMGIPSFAIGDEHFPVGYDGMIRVGEAVSEVLARKKMNQVLQRHVSLPYSDWWLSQKDPFILAKHPEVLDEVEEVQD